MKELQDQRILQRMSFILCICFFFSFGDQKAFSQMGGVYVGDTIQVAQIVADHDLPPSNYCFLVYGVYPKHDKGTDFFLSVPQYGNGASFPAGPYGNIMFAPLSKGIQNDTFFIDVQWQWSRSYDCGSVRSWGGPVIVQGTGISDSIILFRSLNPYNLITYFWNVDSNKYFGLYSPPNNIGLPQPIELVNNVETSTKFEVSVTVDPAAPVHPVISVDGDSSSFPKSYLLGPKIRRKRGFIYFFTDSKGFNRDSSFIAIVKVIIHNPTFDDTTNVKYKLIFTAKPFVSVHSTQEKSSESITITSIAEGQRVFISSDFYQPENMTIQLFDALGRPEPLSISQLQIPAGANFQKVEIGNLPSGWYMLRMKTKDQVINKSFMLLR